MNIVITLPNFWEKEADAITMMFQSGLQCLHFRKPGSTLEQCRALLNSIPECYHPRIVLHDHHSLLSEFHLRGVHLNSRNPHVPDNHTGTVSCSCHSLEEVARRKKECDYLSLSPIFDSISKQGYTSRFAPSDIEQAVNDGIIDETVMALGGVTQQSLPNVRQMGFGGAMILGDAWKEDIPVVLSIAGSDSSAGAGIQQDLKVMTHCGCYGATVITAITSQNTLAVQGVMPVPATTVQQQLHSVISDLDVRAVKIGMIPNRDVAKVIISTLRQLKADRAFLPIILDPIMLSTSGTRLMSEDCISLVVEELFPLCTLVTPNIPEHQYLMERFPGEKLSVTSMLLKGGHAEGTEMTDVLTLADTKQQITFSTERVETTNLHGTGCTLSSAIASFMAKRQSLSVAVGNAKQLITEFIKAGANLSIGHGNGPIVPPLLM